MAALPTHTMLLSATELSLSYDYLCLLDKVSIAIRLGEKIGLVGRNGCGKSSLLKILAQESSADSGDCSRRKGLRVGYLPQAFELNETLSVRDNILEGASELYRAKHDQVCSKTGGDSPCIFGPANGIDNIR